MRKWDENSRNYRHCLALPFWAHIDTSGNVWACGAYVLDERFRVGNINEKTFKEIWEGKRRVELAEWAIKKLNTTDCRVNCRMDDINRYLWDLIHPSGHVNFI
jgi:radical SAM protein with 4Fe4S-binding SPASM domain